MPPADATPTPLGTTTDDADGISNGNKPGARDRAGGDSVPGGGASDAEGAQEMVETRGTRSATKVAATRDDAFGRDPSWRGSTPADESRAVPVPVPRFQRPEDDGGGEGTEGSKNRAGFHSYDETHQVIERLRWGNN